ncbi:unnamed protein product [Dicrocoelium dendriticum]|nr:unnamed protein product [Dicrocoelium dendriticum]
MYVYIHWTTSLHTFVCIQPHAARKAKQKLTESSATRWSYECWHKTKQELIPTALHQINCDVQRAWKLRSSLVEN